MKSTLSKISVTLLFILLAVGSLNIVACEKTDEDKWNLEIDKRITLTFEYLQESKYDMDAVKEANHVAEDAQYLYVEEVPNQNVLERFEGQGSFLYTEDFDFDNYWMIIAYGREIVELERVSSQYIRNHYGPAYNCLSVTFGKEYFGDTVFFYRIAKAPDFVIVRTHYLLYANTNGGMEKAAVDFAMVNKIKNTAPVDIIWALTPRYISAGELSSGLAVVEQAEG